ncbi:uncharacterized protein G2W53_043376 [Senna tora]|uniref:Uncharacterized protein n=1 Tax=Senna tora TaxID=362788 RepID=A0A834SGX9_9FABA|nr:uncharacterized protein G2W53_043376 [Senna tora]
MTDRWVTQAGCFFVVKDSQHYDRQHL